MSITFIPRKYNYCIVSREASTRASGAETFLNRETKGGGRKYKFCFAPNFDKYLHQAAIVPAQWHTSHGEGELKTLFVANVTSYLVALSFVDPII